ncbi:MAG: hypothetical protein H0W25_17820 [Acidimicrobiia bacterium]|nr:hypothetical protein [Acidimicrobiia bacterium]
MTSTDPIEHPDLVDALVQLADALDRRPGDGPRLSHLAMAVLADQIAQLVHDLARSLVVLARSEDGASWTDVGVAFGVTRQAALRRWRIEPSRTASSTDSE